MAVVINEVEHVAPPDPMRGADSASARDQSAMPPPSANALRDQVLMMLRREAHRAARLWAD